MAEDKKSEFKIIVNTREKDWDAEEISFDQLVSLAFNPVPTGDDLRFLITYRAGVDGASGKLSEGQSVAVKNGMVFDVTPSNKS